MKVQLTLSILASLAAALPVAAQQKDGDAVAGKELASQLCSGCHIVGTERRGSDIAPPFAAIARDPDVTLTELHGWIGAPHPMLSQLALTSRQIADINAYLDALHDAPAKEATPGAETGQRAPALGDAPPEKLGEPIKPSD